MQRIQLTVTVNDRDFPTVMYEQMMYGAMQRALELLEVAEYTVSCTGLDDEGAFN